LYNNKKNEGFLLLSLLGLLKNKEKTQKIKSDFSLQILSDFISVLFFSFLFFFNLI
jgi:hypothetical protein